MDVTCMLVPCNVYPKGGSALKYISKDLRKDKKVVLAAVQNYGFALEHASKDLKNDKKIVLAAVQNYGLALEYASEDLQNDKDLQNIKEQYARILIYYY